MSDLVGTFVENVQEQYVCVDFFLTDSHHKFYTSSIIIRTINPLNANPLLEKPVFNCASPKFPSQFLNDYLYLNTKFKIPFPSKFYICVFSNDDHIFC